MTDLRIHGMISGFDVEEKVSKLMEIEKKQVDHLQQQKQIKEWTKEQSREIINDLRSFQEIYFNPDSQKSLMSSDLLKQMEATSSDSDIVSVSADADAIPGNISFKLLESATRAEAESTQVTDGWEEGERLNLSTEMGELDEQLLYEGEIEFTDGQLDLEINGETVAIYESDTLEEVVSKINTSNAGISFTYSSFSDTFSATARETGDDAITVNDAGNFFTALGFSPDEDGKIGSSGRDASFEINGFAGTRSSNMFTIDGITYNINKELDETSEPQDATITVENDAEGTFEFIENFVDDYNKLIVDINDKLVEERYRDYPPLTEEQKNEMSEKEIEQWEEMAKSGLLRQESSIDRMLINIRQALSDSVDELNLFEIGIETSRFYQDKGQLVLADEGNKLRETIESNPSKVEDLFAKKSDTAYNDWENRSQRYEESGIAYRVHDILQDNIRISRDNRGSRGILIERAGSKDGRLAGFESYYDRQIENIDERIERTEEKLRSQEEYYYQQFSRMERALHEFEAQSNWLRQQLGSGGFF